MNINFSSARQCNLYFKISKTRVLFQTPELSLPEQTSWPQSCGTPRGSGAGSRGSIRRGDHTWQESGVGIVISPWGGVHPPAPKPARIHNRLPGGAPCGAAGSVREGTRALIYEPPACSPRRERRPDARPGLHLGSAGVLRRSADASPTACFPIQGSTAPRVGTTLSTFRTRPEAASSVQCLLSFWN